MKSYTYTKNGVRCDQ